jgi:hypothetical protein
MPLYRAVAAEPTNQFLSQIARNRRKEVPNIGPFPGRQADQAGTLEQISFFICSTAGNTEM